MGDSKGIRTDFVLVFVVLVDEVVVLVVLVVVFVVFVVLYKFRSQRWFQGAEMGNKYLEKHMP